MPYWYSTRTALDGCLIWHRQGQRGATQVAPATPGNSSSRGGLFGLPSSALNRCTTHAASPKVRFYARRLAQRLGVAAGPAAPPPEASAPVVGPAPLGAATAPAAARRAEAARLLEFARAPDPPPRAGLFAAGSAAGPDERMGAFPLARGAPPGDAPLDRARREAMEALQGRPADSAPAPCGGSSGSSSSRCPIGERRHAQEREALEGLRHESVLGTLRLTPPCLR